MVLRPRLGNRSRGKPQTPSLENISEKMDEKWFQMIQDRETWTELGKALATKEEGKPMKTRVQHTLQ